MFRQVLGTTQSPSQSVLEVMLLGAMWPGHEADHTLPSSAKVKSEWSYTCTLPYIPSKHALWPALSFTV